MSDEMTFEEYKSAFEKLGRDISLGTACIIFVQGMASGGHPFAIKIFEMYAKPDESDNAHYTCSIQVENKPKKK